jgi:hypothetical protein
MRVTSANGRPAAGDHHRRDGQREQRQEGEERARQRVAERPSPPRPDRHQRRRREDQGHVQHVDGVGRRPVVRHAARNVSRDERGNDPCQPRQVEQHGHEEDARGLRGCSRREAGLDPRRIRKCCARGSWWLATGDVAPCAGPAGQRLRPRVPSRPLPGPRRARDEGRGRDGGHQGTPAGAFTLRAKIHPSTLAR